MQAYQSETYQVRMYAVFSSWATCPVVKRIVHRSALDQTPSVGSGKYWAASDHYCKTIGYQAALPVIDEWLSPLIPDVL